jgi:hypothetical protein
MSEFEPPPPPPSSVPPPPPGPQAGGFQPPAGGFGPPPGGFPPQPGYAPVGPPPKKGPNKGLIAGIVAAVAVVGGIIAIVATRGGDNKKTEVTVPVVVAPSFTIPDITIPKITIPDVTIPDVTIPDITIPDVTFPDITIPDITFPDVTLPHLTIPDVTIPNSPTPSTGTIVGATDGAAYTNDNGWTMQVPDGWTEIPDASSKGAQAAWYTGQGSSSFGDNVSVQGVPSALDLTTKEFLVQLIGEVTSSYPDATIDDLSVVTTDTGVEYGRIVFTYTTAGVKGQIKTMLTNRKTAAQWLITDFTATIGTFDGELPSVEPYIATLQG